ncbi:MAG TPA: D-hexose-6-phosphate mutarotase [Desulfocapsa sulfexigens]|nr:D-hexose-6-phosphate mutarotase [Desulfocapsa sulfexigens]HIQ37368.1 D-hexose-6-phosphate mutarotase [Desulfocapsa sulfexigens]
MIINKKTATGLEYIEIHNKSATAKVALQGGHLFHYQQQGKTPLLWLSEKSHFQTGKAIRGGIPLCWPWFGKHPADLDLPQHGFARTSFFRLVESNEPDKKTTELVLKFESSASTLSIWPYGFQLILRITVGPSLTVALTTINCDTKAFTISSALHTYFAVSSINAVSVQGLDETEYLDALTGETKIQRGIFRIKEEVDRIYQKTKSSFKIIDSDRVIQIISEGSSSVVVWNPWIDKSTRMADMQADDYKTMLCIETANAFKDARRLIPGEEHTLKVTLMEI